MSICKLLRGRDEHVQDLAGKGNPRIQRRFPSVFTDPSSLNDTVPFI